MDYEKHTLSTEVHSRHTPGKRLLTFFLVFVMILQMCPMRAMALWDGSGDSSGGSLGNVDGTFWMLGTTATDSIIGYRFSVYDHNGDKMGRSVDIDFYHGYDDAYRYRYQKTDGTYDKKSHIDLNREYQKYAKNEAIAPTLGNAILIAEDTEANATYDVYWDTSLEGKEPSAIGDTWLTPDMANDVAKKYCGAASYDSTTDYIICEPLFLVYLQDAYYTLTIAELAVYQAGTVEAIRKTYVKSDGTKYEDTNGWTNVLPYGSTSNLYLNNIGIYTSGVFPRFLYAVNEYSVLGTTPVCEETYSSSNTDGNLYTDSSSNKTLVLPGAHKASTNNYRNTAASLLQYQVGMAVYTDTPENTSYTVNHHLLNASGNEVSVETETVDGVAIGKSITLANCAKSYGGYAYDHAKVGGVTQTTATTLAGGGLSIDLYYKAASTYTVTLIKTTGIDKWYAQGEYLSVTESGNTKVYTCYAGTQLTITATAATNYTFTNWKLTGTDTVAAPWPSADMRVTTNVSLTAYAAINTYTVTWKNWDGTVLETDTGVAYGTTPTYNSATPTRSATAQYSYTFSGWSPAISPVTGNVTYTAQFKETTRTYTVTWVNHNGTVLEKDTGVAYGTTPTYNSATPTKTADAQYSYTFTGWSPAISPVTGDVTYTAQFSNGTNSYTVTWKNWDGTVLETDSGVAYGTTPTYNSATPTRSATAQYSYTFSGWSPAISPVTGNVTYTAQFKETTRTYTVTWVNHNGTVLEKDTGVAYGTTPTYNSATPTKTADAQYSYTFTGWSPAISPVTGDVTYTAQFSNGTNSYTVTWKNWDGTVLETDSGVAYGTTPTYNSATPTRSATAQYSYTFSGWSPVISPVTGNVTYTAQFTATTRKYTVTVIAGTGIDSVTGGNTYDYGTSVTINATPAPGYSWGSWNGTFYTTTQKYTFTVTQDVTVTASAASAGYTMYFADNINLLTGMDDIGLTNTGRMTYSISNGVVTVTSLIDDGYGYTTGRVYLEAGVTYAFAATTDKAWGSVAEAFLMLDGDNAFSMGNIFYYMSSNACVFTPSTTGTYWLRLDVNPNGETVNFRNISISKVVATQGITHDSTYGQDKSTANMIANAGFEGSGNWSGWVRDTSQKRSGSYSLKLSGTTVATVPISTPIVGHKYYAREYVLANGAVNADDCRFEIFGGDGAGKNWVFGWNNDAQPGKWAMISGIVTIDSLNASSYNIRTFVVNAKSTVWVDDMMLVDLTAMFGAGNEPSKEWCDEFLSLNASTGEMVVAYSPLPTLSRTGYEFMGWYSGHASSDATKPYRDHPWLYYADAYGDLKNAFGYSESSLRTHFKNNGFHEGRRRTEYHPADTFTATGDIVVFAGWDAKIIKLTLDGNGGSGHTATVYFRYGINAFYTDEALTQQITAITRPTRTGYTYDTSKGFTGDGTSGGNNGERYIAYDSVEFASDLCTDIYKDATLYANWTINSYYLDLNGWLDGASNGNISGYGTCDIYINGSLVADDCTDYYTQWPYGTSYEIKDIKATTGHTYNGVYSGSISGTIPANNIEVYLNFTTNRYTNTISHWMWGFQKQEGNNGNKQAFHIENTTFEALYGSSFTLNTDRATTIPNGFYLEKTFGTSSITGSWVNYAMGTSVTQNAGAMSFEYDYYPYTYNITYKMNGGTNHTSNPATYNVLYGVTFGNPTRTGYTFAGWYIGDTKVTGINPGETASFGSVAIMYEKLASRTTGDVTVEAHWTPITYNITCDRQNGSGGTAKFFEVYDSKFYIDASSKTAVTAITVPTRTGYTFGGYYTSTNYDNATQVVNASGKIMVDNTFFASDATIYAKWTAIIYTITYDENGGSSVSDLNYTITTDVTLAAAPERDGYTFKGWKLSTEIGNWSSTTYSASQAIGKGKYGSITLVAQWAPITYTIIYNPNPPAGMDYTGTMKNSTHTYNESKALTKNAYTVEHYTFQGWATSPDGTTVVYKDGISVTNLANRQGEEVNLYAVWTPVAYKITCNQMGGAGGTRTFYQTYNEKFSLTQTGNTITKITVPTRQGYVFAGYYTGTNGNGDMIVDAGGTITVGPTYFKKETTIYAYWLRLDIELTDVVLKYKDSKGQMHEIQNLKNIPFGTTVYVYHTYKNSSDAGVYYFGSYDSKGVYQKENEHNMTKTITGYHNGRSGKLTPNYALEAGESVTILAGSFTPDIGAGTATGYVYQSDHAFGDASDEHSEANNTKSVNYIVTFDLELVEIYLTNKDGVRLSERWLAVGQEVYVHHVYRNNSGGAVAVDLYRNGAKYDTITLAANSTKDVVAIIYTQATNGTVRESGAIYRNGYTASTEKYETDLGNNNKSISVTAIMPLTIELVDVDCALRVGTDVFTSFEITNTDIIDFTADDMLTVTMYVYDGNGNIIKTMTMETVIPAEEKQLVWFRWTVPEVEGPYTIKGILSAPVYGRTFDNCSDFRDVVVSQHVATPDTQYEENRPSNWLQQSKPSTTTDSITWYTWSYNASSKQFVKTNYGISVTGGTVTITPSSTTAYQKYGYWYMKSGYGFTLEATDATISTLSDYTMPDADDYTNVQWSYALFPEFMYKSDYHTTVEKASNAWQFWEMNVYGRKHFTPIWYPDSTGNGDMYYVKLIQTEIWTPMGVITAATCSNGIYIEGNMYDDWYIS